MKTEAITYVVYYRVSTKRQGDSGLGLEAQEAYVNHFLEPSEIAGTFTEIESGKSIDNRPKLQEALAYCRENGCGLCVAKLDRLSRNTADALKVLDQLDGDLFACDLPTRPGEKADKFMLTIIAAVADRERELISIRTRQALDARRDRVGEWRVSQLTDADRVKGAAATREAARDAYRGIANYARILREDKGLSLRQIAARLSGEGHRTRRGAEFSATVVKRMLDREQVAG